MSEQGAATAAKIVWFEIPAAQTERARHFYKQLFGWEYETFEGQDYHMSYQAGGAISAYEQPGNPIVYFGVEDIDAAIARVEELGGTGGERAEIPGVGYHAQCQDSEGNRIGLYQDLAGS